MTLYIGRYDSGGFQGRKGLTALPRLFFIKFHFGLSYSLHKNIKLINNYYCCIHKVQYIIVL